MNCLHSRILDRKIRQGELKCPLTDFCAFIGIYTVRYSDLDWFLFLITRKTAMRVVTASQKVAAFSVPLH